MKRFLFPAAAALMLTGCAQEDVLLSNSETNVIDFAVTSGGITRAADPYCNTNLPKKFTVAAAKTGTSDLYFAGDVVTKDGNEYKNGETRFWPEYALDFHAWVDEDGTYAYDADKKVGTFENYTVKDDYRQQLDLMYAVMNGVDREKVKLNFRHALSQVVFKAVNESKLNITVKSVTVGHLANKGNYEMPSTSTVENYENHGDELIGNEENLNRGHWTLVENGLHEYTVALDEALALTNGVQDITPPSHTGGVDTSLILMPQTQAKWDPTKKDAEWNGAYFKLDVVMMDGDKEVYSGETCIPANVEWKQGVRYTYTFKFTDNGHGGYTPNPDDPQPVLGGISYDVTADDFVPGDKSENEMGPAEGDEPQPEMTTVTLSIPAIDWTDSAEVADNDTHSFTIPTTIPTKEDYDFKGWSTTANATAAEYQPGGSIVLGATNANVTLYPVWEYGYEEITISFDMRDKAEAIAPIKVKVRKGEEATVNLPGAGSVKTEDESYGLDGWSTTEPKELIYSSDDKAVPEYNAGHKNVKFSESTKLFAFYRQTSPAVGGGGSNPGNQ